MATIAFVVHPERPEAAAIARQGSAWLHERGHHAVEVWDAPPGNAPGAPGPSARLDATVDLAVSLGGDGTMLRTVALACTHGTPVLGVNLGRLGYLTEVEPDGLEPALERFLSGRLHRGGAHHPRGRGRAGRSTGAAPTIGPSWCSTRPSSRRRCPATPSVWRLPSRAGPSSPTPPTGCSWPRRRARPPTTSRRAGPSSAPDCAPSCSRRCPRTCSSTGRWSSSPNSGSASSCSGRSPAVLVLDGQSADVLEPGDAVVCRVSPSPARLVTFGPRDFFSILRARFHLADR